MQKISDVAELAKVQSIVAALTEEEKKMIFDIFQHPVQCMIDWKNSLKGEEFIPFDQL